MPTAVRRLIRTTPPVERRIQWGLVVFTAALPLIVRPDIERPFSTIKLQLLAIVVPTALAAAALLRVLGRPSLPPALDIALILSGASLAFSSIAGDSVSLSALALPLLGLGWFWTLMAFQPHPARLLQALALSGAVMAGVALLQFVDLDPFRALGWTSEQFPAARMRLFSTLGNPNFVAAFLAGVLPAQLSLAAGGWRHRQGHARTATVAGGLSLVVIALTGSRAASVGLVLAGLWIACVRVFSNKRPSGPADRPSATAAAGLVMVAAVALMTVVGSMTRNPRPIEQAIEGRVYIWTIAVGHLQEYGVAGLGPGSFARVFPSWEAADWQAGRFDETKRPFVAAVWDHAHNEYLELLIEQGIPGLASFLVLLTVFLGYAGRRANVPGVVASSAGVVALLGVAIVDFPFHRPAEAFLFWTLVAAGFLSDEHTVGGQSDFAVPAGTVREAR